MKKTKTLSLVLCLVMLFAILAGCEQTTDPSEESEQTTEPSAESSAITVTDMTGREISLEEPATKVVALTAADCEILYAIGAEEALVGRGEFCDYPEEVSDVQAVESGSETNIEQIIALKPQVVFMNTMNQTKEQVEQLEDTGITVIASTAEDIEGVYYAINMIGTVMGKTDEANNVVNNMKTTFKDIEEKSINNGSQTVYFEVSPLEYGLWTAGSSTFMDEIATMLGLKNAFADVDGWAEISEEQVIERNPDYIVTISMYSGEGPTPTEEMLSRSGWDNLTAIKNRAILNLQNDELTRPGPRLAEGAEMMYNFVSGESEKGE